MVQSLNGRAPPIRGLVAPVMEQGKDPFESLHHIEERLHQQGYKDGYQHGLVEGLKEATDAGIDNGWNVGFEIGFCNGFVETWLHLLKKEPGQERKMKALSAIDGMIRHFQVLNVNSSDYAKDFAQIQAKYRQVLSLLRVPVVVKDKELLF